MFWLLFEEKIMKLIKYIIPVVCLLCVIIFCIIAIKGKIFTVNELPLNFMAAFLGAIVTAAITLILLYGQSMAEEIKEKNVKVFEKKSLLFEKFNNKLYRIVINKKLNANDYIEIKTEFYSKIMLYLKEKPQKKIISFLTDLSNCIGISIDRGDCDLETINQCYEAIKENIYGIINVLSDEIGLGGEIDISAQRQLDNAGSPILFIIKLLEEMDKKFSKEKIFNKARYQVMAYGTFLVLDLKGKFTTGIGIHIGPFFNRTANENFPAYNGIYFRFFNPLLNPLSVYYAVHDEANNIKPLIDFNEGEQGLINLQRQLMPWETISENIDSIINNIELGNIKFDDNKTVISYAAIYENIVKTIVARSFHYYLTATTRQGSLTIKELYEKFESVPMEQFIEHAIKMVTQQ
jgi:hypothetical protein